MTKIPLIIAIAASALLGQTELPRSISVKEFGSKGDGITDDTTALQSALDTACNSSAPADVLRRLYFPAGTYNIRSPLVTRCATSISGDGPAASIIFQTVHATSNHGIIANFPLMVENLSINTRPIGANKGMVAVFRGSPTGPVLGQSYTFRRFHSSGFNFGIDIAGTSQTDILHSVLVEECNISVSTEPLAVSAPVNVGNSELLAVRNSTLTGDGNNDHAIYTIAVRQVLVENNLMRNHGNSAVKLLTGGFKEESCPSQQDYSSWTVRDNMIANSILAVAAYTYCNLRLASLILTNNLISNIPNTYAGDGGAIYIQANCTSAIESVEMSGNVLRDLGLGGVFLLTSVQDAPCSGRTAHGTIHSFVSDGDKYVNFSTSYPGAYSAISFSGPNPPRASVSRAIVDEGHHGRAVLNPGWQVNVADLIEVNTANQP